MSFIVIIAYGAFFEANCKTEFTAHYNPIILNLTVQVSNTAVTQLNHFPVVVWY
jgi:hypothetical protein